MPHAAPRLSTLILLTGLSVLTLNMFLPSLGRIAEEFGVDYTLAALSIGGYLAVSALLQLVVGPLSDRIGRRPVVLAGLAIFTLASIGCWLAPDIYSFLAFRLIQSAIVAGMVIARAIVRDTNEQAEAARLLGVIGMAMALAPILGPVLGGVLDVSFGWRANFLAFALMGAAMLVICWHDLVETNLTPQASFAAQFRQYPELMRSGIFWAYTICLTFSIGGFYAFIGGAPVVGERLYGLSPAWLGAGMGSISAGFMLGNYLTGRWMPVWGALRLILVGRLVASIGPLVALAVIAGVVSHPVVMFAGAIAVGLGNGLTIPGAAAGVMSVEPRLAGSASGLSGAMTVAAGAVLTGLSGWLAAGQWGVYALLTLMALVSSGGLLASLWLLVHAQRPSRGQ